MISGVPKVIGGGLVRVCFSLSRRGDLQCKLNDDRWKDCECPHVCDEGKYVHTSVPIQYYPNLLQSQIIVLYVNGLW